ncbi:MAG: hypothetical protein AAF960_06580 [Bacteroidota bacterium]
MLQLTRLAIWMFFTLILLSDITAQQAPNFIRQQGDYTFGLSGGAAYQQSDVATRWNGIGFGLTYGKNLLYAPQSPFSFDVRSRLQLNRTFGQDFRPSLGIENNSALNGENNLDYTIEDAGGLVYANHRTNSAELGLEGVLTLNGMREATGVGLSFVGGVGLGWYKTKIDQRDADGLYFDQYRSVDAGGTKPFNLSQLKSFQDGDYETLADGFGTLGKVGIMPSLGVELDYDLTNNIAIGLGHRVTFSGTDLLDGQRWTDANTLTGNNDLLHYTSLGLKYSFHGNNPQKNHRKPSIEWLQPYGNGARTTTQRLPIKAIIQRVDNPFDVYLTVNGQEQPFNFSSEKLSGTVRLRRGENKLVLTANNASGEARKTLFITYEPEENFGAGLADFGAPEVSFTYPLADQFETEETFTKINATVRLVDNSNNITVRVNGRKQRFAFDAETGSLKATIDLQTGKNEVVIEAKNRNGEQIAQRQIIRKRPIPKPIVRFTSPARNNAQTEERLATIRATIEYVDAAADVQLLVNNRNESNFRFNTNRQQLTADIQLREGTNTVEIIANNATGKRSATRTIRFDRPYVPTVKAPRVRFNLPQYAESSTFETIAPINVSVSGIFNRNNIRLSNNGFTINDFDFNPNTGILRHQVLLREGINRIAVEVRNEAGREVATTTIRLERPLSSPPPVVAPIIVAPQVDIFHPRRNDVFETDEIRVKANLSGVLSKRDIEFIVNRNDCVDFRFNPQNGRFSANIPLREGENTILLQVANQGGTDRQRITVFRERRNAPEITFNGANYRTVTEREMMLRIPIQYAAKESVRLYQNGNRIRDFRFGDDMLRKAITLREGENNFEILVENKYGRATENWTVDYQPPRPPSISFVNITDKQTFKEEKIRIEALVENISNRRNLTLFVNGLSVRGFNWEDDILSATVRLKEGRNTVSIKANSDFGKETATLQLDYLKPKPVAVEKPTIRFMTKNKFQKTTQQMRTEVVAIVNHIGNKEALQFEVNGKVFEDFAFQKGTFTATVPLKLGMNVFVLRAKNDGGLAEREMTLVRKTGQPALSKSGTLNSSRKPRISSTKKGF